MKSVFDEYQHLWPTSSHAGLQPVLKDVYCLKFPSDKESMLWAKAKRTIIVVEKGQQVEFSALFSAGYEHVVYEEREDFTQELLASALMVVRPENFAKNPMPFFFSGFRGVGTSDNDGPHLVIEFSESREKTKVKSQLQSFCESVPQLRFATDMLLQVADEMITNAIFNAPVLANGERPFAVFPRSEKVMLPPGVKAKLFACYSDQRVVIGCEDPFGSVNRNNILHRLTQIYSETGKSKTSTGPNGTGLGLGMKLMIDNAANFYVYSEHEKKTLIACAFLLGGRKSNMTTAKHMHFSVR